MFSAFLFINYNFSQQHFYTELDIDTVKFSLNDFGKMWTFDDLPIEYFKEKYGFEPDEKWIEHVQKSALQFGNGCSAAFVSPNGLIMTNHHCGRNGLRSVEEEGEDILKNGFYAETMEDERKVYGFYVEQLILIDDVTKEVIEAINSGETIDEKVVNKEEKINELIEKYTKETGLTCKVVTLYNGGKYSMYGYKRYDDIRLVMAPEFQIASTGWDWDNFTYPRYELDFAFYRAYDEEGNPAKSENYFKWNTEGPSEDEVIFTVGRPGNTDRLVSLAELKYIKEVNSNLLLLANSVYYANFELFEKYPERQSELLNVVMSAGNSRKVYASRIAALNNEYLLAKRKDFEDQLKTKVKNNSKLNEKYGTLFDELGAAIKQRSSFVKELWAYNNTNLGSPEYFKIAKKVIKYAEQLKLPDDERSTDYKDENLETTIETIFHFEFDKELHDKLLRGRLNYISSLLGDDNELVKKMVSSKKSDEAVEYVLNKSFISSEEKLNEFLKRSPDEILNSGDPFIHYIQATKNKFLELKQRDNELKNAIEVLNQLLGEFIFDIYGDKIPPDATSTLRLSDGTIKRFEYNGTIAPGKTTFYGLYDRFNSFNKKLYPWGLPPKWENIPEGFDLSTPINFASTNDIVGGNSGSSIINAKAEVIGLAFDGNIESIAGTYAWLPAANRSIGVDSKGLIESLRHVYKTERLVKELLGEN